MEVFEKFSVTPFSFGGFGETKLDLPFFLGDKRIESVEGLLRAKDFSILKDVVSNDSVEFFERAKVALVHQFESGFGSGKKEEDSKHLLHKAFLCLRVVGKLCSNRAIGSPIARHPRRKAFGLFGRA